LATATRGLGRGRPRFEALVSDQSAVVTYPGFGAWKRAALRACIQAARAGDIDGARVLAWANRTVEKINAEVHRAIYGPSAPPYVAGQPVVSHGPILGPDGVPFVSSTCELELLAVEQQQGAIPGDELLQVREALLLKRRTKAGELLPPWRWWQIQARIAGEQRTVEFQVLDPTSRSAWTKASNAIKKLAKTVRAGQGKTAARPYWELFWARLDRFARIDPVWALTIHKSQGSTFRRVFLHPDLDRHTNPAEHNQLAYVAVSRASHQLHVLADPPPPPPGEGFSATQAAERLERSQQGQQAAAEEVNA